MKNLFTKAAPDSNTTELMITINPMAKMVPEYKYHLKMMPSTCVVNQILLPFVSGFRNYAAKMLLYSGTQTKPI